MRDDNTNGLRQTVLWQATRSAKQAVQKLLFEATTANLILPRPFRLVVIAGQKRSGNHVFINWFLSQSRGPCAFFNHVRPHQYPTERHRREFRFNNWRALPTVAFSYEDRDLEDVFSGRLQEFISRHHAQIQSRTLVLSLRDPRNMMASRFKKWPEEHGSTKAADQTMAQWSDYVQRALSSNPPDPSFALVPVYFNNLVSDRAYRIGLSATLGIDDTEKGLDTVTNYGYGSSFSGTEQPDLKGIFERWRAFEDDPVFRRLFDDPKIDLSADALAAYRHGGT